MATHGGDDGGSLSAWIESGRLNDLGPGRPDKKLHDQLAALSPEAITAPHPVADRTMARACLAGLWLRHDFLDESHKISQDIETPTGSYWHGIMHRREPDFGNAKYWFRRVGHHPVFEPLAAAAQSLAAGSAARSEPGPWQHRDWDPYAFVDVCQRVIDEPSALYTLCQQVQLAEWRLLYEYSRAAAAGRQWSGGTA